MVEDIILEQLACQLTPASRKGMKYTYAYT